MEARQKEVKGARGERIKKWGEGREEKRGECLPHL